MAINVKWVRPVPFHSDLDTPLLAFGNDVIRLRDFFEAFCLLGAPGSGKTSSSGAMILRAMLAAGFGGLFLCAKPDAVAEILREAKRTGRTEDLVVIDATGKERFNILDNASLHLGGEGFEQNLVDLMGKLIEATRQAGNTGGGGDGENRFFTDGALKFLSHAFPLLLAAYGTLRMRDVYDFIATAPQSLAEVKTKEWQASFCCRTLMRLATLQSEAKAAGRPDVRLARVLHEHGDFYLTEVPALDNRPRSSIVSTLTNMIYPFLAGKLNELFCTTTTITPQAARDGKLIVMDLPTLSYGAAGAVSQIIFKYLFGLMMQTTPTNKYTRPVFIFADEAQWFLQSSDADLLATARSSKICVTYITQDLPTYYAKLGSNSRDVAESILSKFGTRIFHANTSRETNQYASELIGKVEKFHVTETRSRSSTTGAGGNRGDHGGGYHGNSGDSQNTGQSTSGYLDYEVPPDYFATKLRTGTKSHRYKTDAIVIRTARTWKTTKRHWVLAEFSQK